MTGLDSSIKHASQAMGLAAHPDRLNILLMLKEKARPVGELASSTGSSQPAISHHLRLMRAGGVVEDTRAGKQVFYSLSPLGQVIAAAARSIMRV